MYQAKSARARAASRSSTRDAARTVERLSRRERPAPGARARRAARRLPADRLAARRLDRRRRGAAALAASRARAGRARGVHPGRRGERPDRADRALGARRGLRAGRRSGTPRTPTRAAVGIVGEPLGAPVRPSATSRRPSLQRSQLPGIEPSSLCLEITESVLLEEPASASVRRSGASRVSACASCSTTSAPGTPRSPTSRGCRSTA